MRGRGCGSARGRGRQGSPPPSAACWSSHDFGTRRSGSAGGWMPMPRRSERSSSSKPSPWSKFRIVRSRTLGSVWRALLLVACLTAALLLVACGGSGKPGYCSKVDDLKKSVSDLANVKVVQNGTSSVKSAFDTVQNNATATVDALKSDFPNETSA